MSDNSSDFKIQIDTAANTAGAEQTTAALADLRAEAGASAEGLQQVGTIAATEVTEGLKDVEGAAEGTGESLREAGHGAYEGMHLFHGLSSALFEGHVNARQLLGSLRALSMGALTNVFSLAVVAIGLAAEAFMKFREQAEEVKKTLEEVADRQREHNKALEEMQAEEGKQKLKEIADAAKDEATSLDKATKALDAHQQKLDEIANAEMALEIAKVKAGDGTDSEKLMQEALIRRRYAQQKNDTDQAEDQAKISYAQKTINHENETSLFAGGRLKSHEDRAEAAGQIDYLESTNQKLQEAVTDAEAKLASAKSKESLMKSTDFSDPMAMAGAQQAREARELAERNLGDLKSASAKNQDSLTAARAANPDIGTGDQERAALKQAADNYKQTVESATASIKDAQDIIEKAQGDMAQRQTIFGITQQTAALTAAPEITKAQNKEIDQAVNDQAAAAKADDDRKKAEQDRLAKRTPDQVIRDDEAGLLSHRGEHGTVSGGVARQVDDLLNKAAQDKGAGGEFQQILKIVTDFSMSMAGAQSQTRADMARFQSDMERIQSQLKTTPLQ